MLQFLNSHYIDLIIIAILIYFLTEAFRHGFWVIVADFFSFFGSLVLSLRFYKQLAVILKLKFALNTSVANALSYMILAIIFEALLGFITGFLIYKLPDKVKKHRLNKFLGVIPGLGEGIALSAFILTLVMALPIKPQIKEDIVTSKIGSVMLEKTSIFESAINDVFGGVINDSLTYFTVSPDSKDMVTLDVTSFNLITDKKAEMEMFNMLNAERKKLAIKELVFDEKLANVGRNHATDMWKRKYFSHFSPENKNVGDRLKVADISYEFAGENLALAPTTKTAFTGLMNSKGHRENMLEPRFKKVGIGTIDNGIYGKMYVQVFID